MSLSLRYLFAIATTMAIAWAQTAGIQRGYLCDCGDQSEVTAADHCHGPHTQSCHNDELCTQTHDDRHHPQGDKRDHPAVIDTLLARHDQSNHAKVKMPAAKFACLKTSGFFMMAKPQAAVCPLSASLQPSSTSGAGGWPKRLAHTIALRI